MKIQTPRRSRRVPMNCPGRYMGPSDQDWLECRVIDLSLDGAALEVPIPTDEPSVVTLELQDGDGHPIGLELRGAVSNWEAFGDDRLRIGVAFVDMTSLQRYKLAGLLSAQRRAAQ